MNSHDEDLAFQGEDGALIITGVSKSANRVTNGIGVSKIGGPLVVRKPMTTKYASCINNRKDMTIAKPNLVRSSLVIEKKVAPDTMRPIPQNGR